ncbi:MAG: arsenate reductase family protein [Nibricoccus sp.]
MPNPPAVVYVYSGCSTCRDALKWLNAHKIAFTEKPIRETPPSASELKQMLAFQNGNLRRLFNTSGLEYRALKLSDKLPAMSEDEALTLLESNGKLVKRPFVLGEKFGLVGFDEEAWSKVFKT